MTKRSFVSFTTTLGTLALASFLNACGENAATSGAGDSPAGDVDVATASLRPRHGTGGSTHVSTGGSVGSATGGAAGGAGGSAAGGTAGTATGGAGGTGGAVSGTGGSATTAAWRPFNASSPWNTPIASDAQLDAESATMITDFASIPGQDQFWINIQDYSVPVYYVDSTVTPAVTVVAALGSTGFRTGAADDSVDSGTGTAPIPTNAVPAIGSDAHLLVVDKKLQKEWGFYLASKNSSGTGWKADLAATLDLAGSGVRPPEQQSPWWAGHGPRACGFGLANGLITPDEVRAGHIDHALVIAYPHIRSRYYTPPASSAQAQIDSDAIPTRGVMCGGRMQLDPTLDVTKLGLSATGLMIARALQQYGAFVGDYSGAVSLYADESPDAQAYWKTVGLNNETAGKIPLNRFRVLQIGTKYDNMN